MLFQAQIQEHQQLAEHYRNLAAQREAKAAELVAIEQEVMGAVQTIKGIQEKLDPGAAATLQSQILNLLGGGGDDGGGGGGEPVDNTETTNGDGRHYQTAIDFNHYHLEAEPACPETETPEASGDTETESSADTPEPENLEGEVSPEPEKPAFTEFVEVSDRVGYLKIQHSGEIKAVYAGFSQKQRAESWGKWLAVRHSIASGFEVRAAKHLPFKWELKLWGLNMNQINRLASENLAASPHTEVDSAKPPSYKKPEHPQPVSAEAVKPGDIVAPLLSPENTYEVIQVMPNGILDCKSLKTGVNMGMRPAAVTLVSKSEQDAGIIQVGNLIEVKDPTDGEPKTGVVQEISRNPLAPIVVLFKNGSVEEFYRSQIKLLRDISVPAIAFNDLVEVPGQVGVFGRVKIIKDYSIGVEVDEQLEYFETKELKVKVRAADEAASSAPQSQGLKSGQVLMGNRIVTTGNSTGLARRSSTLNTPMGTADKVAALELVNAGLSPELAMAAATGTADSDYDF